ncbi:hypothetical protein SFMTTN_2272 [Sulfuriferula multivorans]|uniref:Uncharacterized protein n=1 Tax=Sulfuriferula multivorans TaxID=1559896 RepID=A0A401JFS5_9PROT|nr:hypothetical protein SFMTTN_2272 [Sulfuriferula multivorans]
MNGKPAKTLWGISDASTFIKPWLGAASVKQWVLSHEQHP